MLPDPVIDRQVTRQPGVSLLGVLERHRIGPFLAEGLDEPLRLAIGAWRVEPGADVLEVKGPASLGKGLGDMGRAVVAHDLAALHALSVEPGHSENLHVGEPCGVIDGDVDPVVIDASRTALLRIAGDPVPHRCGSEPAC